MIEFSLDEIARITGGHLVGADATVSASVVTDSRECVPGSLYVARVGEHADGHDYAPAARDAGAVGVLIAVLVLKAPVIGEVLFEGSATPQVPVTAVIVGMLVSIGIGALAGLVPALVAMRVRIIDAIRA